MSRPRKPKAASRAASTTATATATKPAPRKRPVANKAAASSSNIAAGLLALATPIGEIQFAARNARKHPDRSVSAIQDSLRQFGQRSPIIVHRETKEVLAGNGRLMAARALGWDQIAVLWVDDDKATASAYAIADNRTADLSEWDYGVLAAELADLVKAQTFVPGYTAAEIADLTSDLNLDAISDAELQKEHDALTRKVKDAGMFAKVALRVPRKREAELRERIEACFEEFGADWA